MQLGNYSKRLAYFAPDYLVQGSSGVVNCIKIAEIVRSGALDYLTMNDPMHSFATAFVIDTSS